MRFAAAALLALSMACDGSPDPAGVPCAEHRDCEGWGRCGPGDQCEPVEDPRVAVHPNDRLHRADAGVRDPDAGRVPPDGGGSDAASIPDAGPVEGADGSSDAGPNDTGPADFGSPDLGPEPGPWDAGGPDSGDAGGFADAGDAGSADAGASSDAGAVFPGQYSYRRVVATGLPSDRGLWRVAYASAGDRLVAATHGGRLFVIDLATEAVERELLLPLFGGDGAHVGDIAAAGPGRMHIAATTFVGPSPTGRVYELDLVTKGIRLLGSTPGIFIERILPGPAHADLVGYEDLGGGQYLLALLRLDGTGLTVDRMVPSGAGCEGLARAADGIGGTGLVFGCGVGGGDLGHVDSTGAVVRGPGVGNVGGLDAPPGGNYALAVGWASARLLRFEQGTWQTGHLAPDLGSPRLSRIRFCDDGSRALVVGGYDPGRRRAELREHRRGAYADLRDVSIAGFDGAPWLGVNGSGIFDATWQPGCDGGFLVGGCGGVSCGRGWLIRFDVGGGRPCPTP